MHRRKLMGVLVGGVLLAALIAVVAVAATSGGGSWTGGWQMMGGRYASVPAHAAPVKSLAAARADAQRFANGLGLRVDEVLQFQRNFYAKLVDAGGSGATEVLVDPPSGAVSIEYGPAMMWNTRYGMMNGSGASMMGSYGASLMSRYGNYVGMMRGTYGSATSAGGYTGTMMGGSAQGEGGMMGGAYGTTGGSGGAPTAETPANGAVSVADAHVLAQHWLDANEPGVQVESGGDAFPGYYTLETLKSGKITGMISVNATSGAVWPHWWHGAFIASAA
jgi:hypothetical protein